MKLVARDYQSATVDAFFDYWIKGQVDFSRPWGNPVAALPTGTGKSIIIAEFCRRALAWYPSTRILVLTHVKELVGQNYEKLLELWPTAPAGIYSAGLGRKDVGRNVTFAGIGSIANAVHLFKPDLILIDECHTVSPSESTTYRKAIAHWKAENPMVKVAGLTATPFRVGQGQIIEPGGIFDEICFDLTTLEAFNWFISEGYLAPLVPKQMKTDIDVSGVKMSRGDFDLKQLQATVDKEEITRAAVAEIIEEGEDRNHWLIFAAGVKHANHIAAILAERGVAVGVVHSNTKEFPMTDAERDEQIEAFKTGKIRALVNNGVLTTGFDFPGIDLIAVLRHTTSPGLWVQMLGRGTRPLWFPGHGFDLSTREGRLACIAAGKFNCLVLDFAQNTLRLGPINDPVIPKSRKKKADDTPGDCPAKVCEVCMTYNHATARVCTECGAEFVFKIKIEKTAGNAELIRGSASEPIAPIEEFYEVENVTYSKHVAWNGRKTWKGGVPAKLRVCYHPKGTLLKFYEYISIEAESHELAQARQWWTTTSNAPNIPESVDKALALAHTLKQPAKLRVWINRKNPKVMHREFSES